MMHRSTESVTPSNAAIPDLSRTAARTLLLAAQGLLHPPQAAATKAAALGMIRQMGALQIDTIHIVARSPYLVLWSRLGDYDPVWLDELLVEGALFEYWSHAACLLPIEEYPFYRRLMLDGLKVHRTTEQWLREHPQETEQILERIRASGSVRSADFVRSDGRRGTWWDRKPEKQILELLHNTGALMTARRVNFQRIYDLRERVLPSWQDSSAPSLAETRRRLALQAVRALGVATAAFVPDYFRLPKAGMAALLESLAGEGALLRTRIEGWPGSAYVHPDNRAFAEAVASGLESADVTTLLSPFDPIVWDRARGRSLFDFDYTIECYTPAAKRRYGYFTLPILRRGELIGRLDPKAHRKAGVFEVKAIHLEPRAGAALTQALVDDVAGALRACARWHRTPEIVVRASEPPALAKALTASLKRRRGR